MKVISPVAWMVVACSVSTALGLAPPAEPGQQPSQKTQIVLLGTGTPNTHPDRSGPATAIVVNGTPYLVDCGPGVARRAAAAVLKGVTGLRNPKLGHVFITHLHTDHTLGLADLMYTPWVLGRDRPLEAFGPKGLRNMVDHLHQAYAEDVDLRINGLEPANTEGYKVNVHEIDGAGIVYKDENVTVKAIPVIHGSWKQAFAYRFETADRTIVISGDATYSPSLIEGAKGADVLIHEVYSQAGWERREPEWKTYHAAFHTSTIDLARIANAVKPGLLILYHQLYMGATDEELIAEIKRTYSGKVVSGKDLDIY